MGLYGDLEKKYYDALDSLDQKGIPVYSVVDVFEKNNVPSFPIFLILVALLIIGLGWLVLQLVVPPTAQLTIRLANEENVGIPNEVMLVTSDNQTLEQTTNASGEAIFDISPYPTTVRVSIKDESDFESSPQDVIVNESVSTFTFRVREKLASFTGTASLIFSDTKQVVTNPVNVELSCSGNESFSTTIAFTDGTADLVGIPSDCEQLMALASTGKIVNSPLNPTEENLTFEFSEQAQGTGTLLVTVLDQEGKTLAGKTVTITASDSTPAAGIQVSAENGVATFSSIHAGVYTIYASDPAGEFSPIQSQKTFSVEVGKTTDANIQMNPSSSVTLVVQVTNLEGQPISNAQVELKKDNVRQGFAQTTDGSGRVELFASNGITYDIQVDHADYFIAVKKGINATNSPIAVQLTPTGPDNQTLLQVTVQDEMNQPISGAIVVITGTDGKAISDEQTTGDDGGTTFWRLAPGNYSVVASRPGFGSDIQPVTLKAREVTQSVSTITIGSGTINLQVLTENNQPAGNGFADVFNAENNAPLIQNIPIQSDGTVKIPVRADQTVYITARVNAKAPTTAGPFQTAKDATTNQIIHVLDDVTEPAIELQAIFDGTQLVDRAAQQLSAGKTYQLEYAVRLPASQAYTQVLAHIRSDSLEGPTDNLLLESDVAFFATTAIKAPFATAGSGISFSPPQGQGIDFARNKNDQAKWVNLSWSQPNSGTILVTIPYTVRDYATTGQSLELLRRLEIKTGTKLERFPTDDVLSVNANTLEKQGLYAKTVVDSFKVGVSAACSQSVCASLSATNMSQNIAVVLSENIDSEVGTTYALKGNFTTTSAFIPGLTTLRLTNADGGLVVTDVKLQLANGRSVLVTPGTDTTMGFVGGQESFALALTAKTAKEGTSSMMVQLVQDNTVIWEKNIRFATKAGSPLGVSIVPKAIVANADNHVLVLVKDSSDAPLAGAVVSAFVNDVLGPQSLTNSDGKAEFTLSDLAAGSQVIIRVEKIGFAPFEQSYAAGNEVLLAEPILLMESFTVDGKAVKNETLILRNATNQALTITAIKWPTMQNYASVRVISDNIPMTIEPDGNVILNLEFKMTAKGQSVVRPLAITQNAAITVVDVSNKKRYVQNYPVNLVIGLNGFTDSADCFSVSPGTWKLITSGEQAIIQGEMTNNCTADEEPISLMEARARIDWENSNPIGTFMIQSLGADSRGSATLSNTLQAFSGTIPKGGKVPIQLTFNASSIPSGTSQAIIEVVGINRTEDELQTLSQKIAVDITVNNVYACIKVASTGRVEVVTNPIQLGLGLYQSNATTASTGTANAVPSYIVPSLPANFPDSTYRGGFIDPYQGNYQSPANPSFTGTIAQSATTAPGTTNQIQVTNSCASPVDIVMNVPEQITVSKATFQVKPKESEFVTIQSGYKPGQFDVTFFGKASGSSVENAARIASVPVNVRTINPQSLGANCISLSTNQFAFNNLPGVTGGFPAQVTNRCYTSGVRLMDGGSAIQLFDNGLSNYPQSLNPQPYYANYLQMNQGTSMITNSQYPNAATYPNMGQYSQYQQAGCNCVQGQACPCNNGGIGVGGVIGGGGATPYPVGTTTGQPTLGLATGVIVTGRYTKGNTEVVQFMIQRNSGYQQSPAIPATTPNFATNGPTGTFYGGYAGLPTPQTGGSTVTNPGTLSVNFTDAWGNAQSKNFPVLLTDIMPPAGLMQQLDRRGNLSLQQYQECVVDNGINIVMDDAWFAENCVNAQSGQPCMVGEVEVEINSILRVDRDHCSLDDYLDYLEPDMIEQDGATIWIYVKDNRRHPIVIRGDRTNLSKNQTILNQSLTGSLVRPLLGRDQEVKVGSKFTVVKYGFSPITGPTGPGSTATLQTCTEKGFGGSFVPRNSYDWKWDSWATNASSSTAFQKVELKDGKIQLTESTPEKDSKKYYADGAQFAIELTKKIGTPSDGLMKKVNAAREKKLTSFEDSSFTDDDQKRAFLDSQNLYRFLKKQIIIKEIKNGASFSKAFFVKSDNQPIARPLTELEKSESDRIENDVLERARNELRDSEKIAELARLLKTNLDSIQSKPNFKTAWEDTVLIWGEVDVSLLAIEGVQMVSKETGAVSRTIPAGYTDAEKEDYYLIQTATSAHAFINQVYDSCFTIVNAATIIANDCQAGPVGIKMSQMDALGKVSLNADFKVNLDLLRKYTAFKLITAARNDRETISKTERDVILSQAIAAGAEDASLENYYRDMEFNAFLMRDQLSADFWNDFKAFYGVNQKDMALFDLIGEEGVHRIGKKNSEDEFEPVTFEEAGKYKIHLKYTWDNSDASENHEKDTLSIDATLASNQPALSALYDLSLDGPLGSKKIPGLDSQMDGTRDGYGTEFIGIISSISGTDMMIGAFGTDAAEQLRPENLQFMGTNAFNQAEWKQQFEWDKYNADEREKGQVLAINKTAEGKYQVAFTPSMKIKMEALLRGQTGQAAWDYHFENQSGIVVNLPQTTIGWKSGGAPFAPASVNGRGFCGQPVMNGFEITKTGTNLMGTMFVPPSVAPSQLWYLASTCATPELSLKVERVENGTIKPIGKSSSVSGISNFHDLIPLNENTKPQTWQSLLDHAVKENGYCFVERASTTRVVWQ